LTRFVRSIETKFVGVNILVGGCFSMENCIALLGPSQHGK